MLETLRNAWKIQDLRKKMLYTLLMLFIFRIGTFVPIPWIDSSSLQTIVEGNSVLALLNMFNGGALQYYSFFATGITPYITASIVFQLLTVAIPKLEALQKEGEEGRKKIVQYTRYASIVMALIQSIGVLISMGSSVLTQTSWHVYATIGIMQAAGSAICMWIGDRITERGVGNGVSLLIFINIVSSLSSKIASGIQNIILEPSTFWIAPLALAGGLLIVVAIVFIDLGERRIPVQYAKRVVGRKMFGGQSTHIPMKVNGSNVMPIIFAMTILSFPSLIIQMFFSNATWAQSYLSVMSSGTILYGVIAAIFIIFFAFFYSTIAFNPIDVSKNIQQNGGFIPGIRPGRPTSDYMARINARLTMFSAVFLALLAVIPMVLTAETGSSPMGSTSILILVGVALETSKQLESQMLMRHYKGFLK